MPWPRCRKRKGGAWRAGVGVSSSGDGRLRKQQAVVGALNHLRPALPALAVPANGGVPDYAEAIARHHLELDKTRGKHLAVDDHPLSPPSHRSHGVYAPPHALPPRPRRPLQARFHHLRARPPRLPVTAPAPVCPATLHPRRPASRLPDLSAATNPASAAAEDSGHGQRPGPYARALAEPWQFALEHGEVRHSRWKERTA